MERWPTRVGSPLLVANYVPRLNISICQSFMMRGIAFLLCLTLTSFGKLTPEQREKLPPPVDHPVDFTKEIKPILEASCIKCHGRGKSKGGFAIDNRETFLKGGDSGAVAIVGKSGE